PPPEREERDGESGPADRRHGERGPQGADATRRERPGVIADAPAERRADAEEKGRQLDDELARRAGEVAVAVGRDDEHVLEADAADRGVVDTGLDRDDVASLERDHPPLATADRGQLVDLEPDAMARAVEEPADDGVIGLVLVAGSEGVVSGLEDDV